MANRELGWVLGYFQILVCTPPHQCEDNDEYRQNPNNASMLIHTEGESYSDKIKVCANVLL